MPAKPILSAILLLTFSTTLRAGVQPQPIEDWDILEALEAEFRADAVVSPDLLDVEVDAGIVSLSGGAFTLLAKRRAARLAASLKGVRAVVNNLEVLPSARTDQEILADVKAALRDDPVADHQEIETRVGKSQVTLKGTVDSYAEKQLVDTAVAGVLGVTDVNNLLTVQVHKERSDEEIKPEILRRLQMSPYVSAGLVDVTVENGRVKLTGAVGSAREKSTARVLAWVAGVRNVDVTGLKVKWWLRDEMTRGKFSEPRNDEQVQRAVEDALLYDPRVRGMKIDVRVRQGTVWLGGSVSSLSAKLAAGRDAQNTIGVRRVVNHLKVRPEHWPGDPAITRAANEALARDAHVGGLDVRAASHFGKAHLRGEVDSFFEKRRAAKIVANVPGTLDVINRIHVDADWRPKLDDDIKADTLRQLRFNALIDAGAVTVTVSDGVITLSGTVESRHARSAAENAARRAGARRVINKLEISANKAKEQQTTATERTL